MRNRVVTDLFRARLDAEALHDRARARVRPRHARNRGRHRAGTLSIANYTIRDVHPAASLTISQVLQKSSNVGAAKLALALPREAMWDLFHREGFGAAPEIGFPAPRPGSCGRTRPGSRSSRRPWPTATASR